MKVGLVELASYVYQQIICSESFLKDYLFDYYPLGEAENRESPYITFNKLVGVKSLNEYAQNFGAYIYYGYGFTYKKRSDGKFIVKFATRWEYPISAIQKAIEIDNTVEWYAVEESCIYVSRFYYEDKLLESVTTLQDDFVEWAQKHIDFEDGLSDDDHIVWYYLLQCELPWVPISEKLDLPKFY
ncbi:TPA: hypothetical protein ACG5KU_002294 [Streptococcus agalactiae]